MSLYLNDVETELVRQLLQVRADFVIVGGAAIQHYGLMRVRSDLDILIRADRESAEAVAAALGGLRCFVPASEVERLAQPKAQLQIDGLDIEILSGEIAGVTFEDAKRDAAMVYDRAGSVPVLSREHMIANKRAGGRPKDQSDLAFFEGS